MGLKSFQNLLLLQNLYRLKAVGYEYSDTFVINLPSVSEKPSSFALLAQSIATCHLCDLSKSRKQSMSGYGNQNADVMFIDHVVSLNEDENNAYYCGRSGEILTNMIQNVLGLKKEDVYFTHTIKCKPRGSNMPSASEWDSCKEYLFAQIDFIQPKVVVTLGREAYEKVTSEEENFQSVRGHVIEYKNYKLIPIHHPSHLLRNPDDKKIAMRDLLTIKSCL